MVVDKITNIGLYSQILMDSYKLARFFENSPKLAEQQECKVEGTDYIFTPFAFQSEHSQNRRWEIHRNHIDIHLAINGRECVEWIPVELLQQSAEYISDTDVEFFSDTVSGVSIVLEEGYFALMTPADAHKPSVLVEGVNGGIKAVIKADA